MNNVRDELDAIKKRIKVLNDHIDRSLQTYGALPESFDQELILAVIDSERICLRIRDLAVKAAATDKPSLLHAVASQHNIEINGDSDEIEIHLPVLPLKEKAWHGCSFITDPLWEACVEFTRKVNIERFRNCRITFKHLYKSGSAHRYLRDYDNYEVKKVLDVLAVFFLIDDNARLCETRYISEETNRFGTEITIEKI